MSISPAVPVKPASGREGRIGAEVGFMGATQIVHVALDQDFLNVSDVPGGRPRFAGAGQSVSHARTTKRSRSSCRRDAPPIILFVRHQASTMVPIKLRDLDTRYKIVSLRVEDPWTNLVPHADPR